MDKTAKCGDLRPERKSDRCGTVKPAPDQTGSASAGARHGGPLAADGFRHSGCPDSKHDRPRQSRRILHRCLPSELLFRSSAVFRIHRSADWWFWNPSPRMKTGLPPFFLRITGLLPAVFLLAHHDGRHADLLGKRVAAGRKIKPGGACRPGRCPGFDISRRRTRRNPRLRGNEASRRESGRAVQQIGRGATFCCTTPENGGKRPLERQRWVT